MKKTVIHFIYSDVFSGLERVAAGIIKNLPEDWQGYYAAPQGDGIEACKIMGIPCIPCDTHSISGIKKVIEEYSPDAVHAHDPHICLNVALTNTPFVGQLHANCHWMKGINKNSIGLLLALLRAENVFCVSPAIMNDYIFGRFFEKKSETLYNVVDVAEVLSKGDVPVPESYHICYVGRFSEEKHPEKFAELVHLLKEDMPDIRAVMVGDGKLREKTESLCRSYSLEKNIDFVGFSENPYKYMNASGVCAVTSSYEGFGLVAVEAMMLGLPVVCFPAGGITDIVNGDNGKVCRSLDEMKNEVLKLLSDADLYEKKSACAEQSSKRFTDVASYMEKIVKSYERIIK